MMNESLKRLCYNYFSGRKDDSAAGEIRRFIHEKPENLATFRQWENQWKQTEIPSLAQVRAFKRIRTRISARKAARVSLWTASVAAAAALLLILLPTGRKDSSSPAVQEPNIFTVETRYCEQTKVVLPDSTIVWLNAASRLSYSGDYMKGERTVTLEGEGYFDVRHNPAQPFIVRMGANDITVYGTKFNVTAYPSEAKVEAALLEGSIAFSNSTIRVEMQPGEILSYDTSDEKLVKYAGDVKSRVSWLGGTLVYSAIDLGELLGRISSIYGERITCVNSGKGSRSVSIILNIKESIPNILDAISYICPVKWTVGESGEYIVETI